MFEGLNMAWKSGYRKVIVESNSLTTIQLLTKDINSNHRLLNLVQNYKRMIVDDWICEVVHVYREVNMVADGLAWLGHGMAIGLIVLGDPPLEIKSILKVDANAKLILGTT
ncbi:hypothetical protein Ddye_009638 [Dipteronia dyeriana]|uniref:RNase H type-1 domain-containing protein n=1 Tax=Dipteronia dyeriana TaxID=168575 RepID=A0AAD9XCE0_9ROSI|nr:hypothetical protein Ddye_009638 [Dipteronia dyeriana]